MARRVYSLPCMKSQRPGRRKLTDLSGVREELTRLLSVGEHDALVDMVMGLLEKMAEENKQLALRLRLALGQPYRRKSERLSPEQLTLFLSELLGEEDSPAGEGAEKSQPPSDPQPEQSRTPEAPPAPEQKEKPAERRPEETPPRRPRGKFSKEEARREIRFIPVPQSERVCKQCSGPKEPMGYEARAFWEYKPAEFYIIEERLEKCVCKSCEEGVVTAPASSKPIPGGLPGPGLLAQIITSKFRDSCPLYRQAQIYQRSGVALPPSTMGDWVAAGANLLEPLWRVAREETLRCSLISTDDVPMPVLDREDPQGIKKGRIWTYLGDVKRVGFCEYTRDWKGDAPLAVLESFQGEYVQGDGYAGINAHFKKPDAPKRAGCMDHARRKFVQALEGGHLVAARVLELMQRVYALEKKAREEGLGEESLLQMRQSQTKPIMHELKALIDRLHLSANPKGLLGKATTYAIKQWETLRVFLEDARVPLSNAHVERQQRRTVLGRKNYLFAGSDDAAQRLAILQTFVVLCELCKVPLFEYLRDVFAKLPSWPVSRLKELLPAAWQAAQQQALVQAQVAPATAARQATQGQAPEQAQAPPAAVTNEASV